VFSRTTRRGDLVETGCKLRRIMTLRALPLVAFLAACGDNLTPPSDQPDAPDMPQIDAAIDAPTEDCGNNAVEGSETCDGTDLAGETCETLGWGGGTLGCASDCAGFDETACTPPAGCGDGVRADPEECDDGNTMSGDGCEGNCMIGAGPVTTCRVVTPLPSGVCDVTAGDGSKLIVGTVLTPGKVWRGGHVLVDATGAITCTGCNCPAPTATVIDCPGGVISPGLINAHDHITFAHNAPYTDIGERYEHRHDWRLGQNDHTEIDVQQNATSAEIRWGELRFVMGGATSTSSAGSATGLLRNIDGANQEQLGQPAIDLAVFPLDDAGGTRRTTNCNYGDAITAADIAGEDAFSPHVTEGIDRSARNEFLCMSSTTYDTMTPGTSDDLVLPQSAFIHGIALFAPDFAQMARDGTALIWSPRSNVTLYGDTATVTHADVAGVEIALGTDWTPTGSMNMLRELACADSLNADYYGGYFSDADLWEMATINNARAFAMDDAIGVLAVGRVADIAIFDGDIGVDHRAVIDAEPATVALVLRGGEPLYGDDAVIIDLGQTTCDTVDVCGTAKRVCLMGDIGQTLAQLEAAAAPVYPAFFCGVPDDEPSCVPMRPEPVNGSTIYTGAITVDDPDGDGIEAGDNCPSVFNPVRPVDDGEQADFDGDGDGDACDVCPRDAGVSTCSTWDPADLDSDGLANGADNCPDVPNPTQADADTDLKGDACDACPNDPNPGAQGCPTTIYDIKRGVVDVGATVAIVNALVTGRNASGYFLQVKQSDTGYMGADDSGIFVFHSGNTVAAGDRVTIATATVQDFFGQIQLSGVSGVVVNSSGEALPIPIVETAANVATGGMRAAALEGVIVQVDSPTVTDINPPPGPGDSAPTNEFVVDGALRVNDYLYLVAPFPSVNDNYVSLTGILEFRNGHSKLEPRGAGDVVAGAPGLSSFAPGTGNFVRVGQTDVATIPTALTVSLSSAPASDTFVAITSGTPSALTVTGGGVMVLAGMTSATVQVSGLAAAPSVTLTASLGGDMLQATVRVVDPSEIPVLIDLAPATATVPVSGTLEMTVTLDIPPTAAANVALMVSPGAGTVPAMVTVLADEVTATFDYTAPAAPAVDVVTAFLGNMRMSTITTAAAGGALVINEVDYDQSVNPDAASYLEIYNGSGTAVDLTNLAVVLLNGNQAGAPEYARFDLVDAGASLPAGGYLVIRNNVVAVPGGTLVIDASGDFIQNGGPPMPDGIALIDVVAQTVIDRLCYDGAITSATITGFPAPVTLVEGTATTAADDNTSPSLSMIRSPNGTDTDNAMADWATTTTLTPGAANIP
jgi:cysteine-rich repeat protein